MNAFFIGLQFLTRLKIVKQEIWTDSDFGSSVSYFPLVGIVIGGILIAIYWLINSFFSPLFVSMVVVISAFLITGGLHADGLMDTCDGYFSGRSKERSLEIMKDSRVGSNGVVAFVFLVLLKVVMFAELLEHQYLILVAMPTIGRWIMSTSIVLFPYARPQGIGKAFSDHASKKAVWSATVFALVPAFIWGKLYLLLFVPAAVWAWWTNHHLVKKLGGLTGDTYGAVTETTELIVLLSLLIGERFLHGIFS